MSKDRMRVDLRGGDGWAIFFPVGGNYPKGRKYPPCGKDTHHGEKTPTTKYLPWGEANVGEPGDFTSFHVLPPNVKQGFSTCFDKCDSNFIFSQYSPQISRKKLTLIRQIFVNLWPVLCQQVMHPDPQYFASNQNRTGIYLVLGSGEGLQHVDRSFINR